MISKRATIVFLFALILIASQASAVYLSKGNLRPFLKEELAKYFEGQPTTISSEEIRILLEVYSTTSGSSINLEDPRIPESTRQFLNNKYYNNNQESVTTSTDTNTNNNQTAPSPQPQKKASGASCRKKDECQSNRCKKGLFTTPVSTGYCGYTAENNLKPTGTRCRADSECSSRKCVCKMMCVGKICK